MHRLWFILTLCIAALLHAYFCIAQHVREIPKEIENRATSLMSEFELSKGKLAIDGRDVTISGLIISEQKKFLVEQALKELSGVRNVTNRLIVTNYNAIRVPDYPPLPEPEKVLDNEQKNRPNIRDESLPNIDFNQIRQP